MARAVDDNENEYDGVGSAALADGEKVCAACKMVKPLSDFTIRASGNRAGKPLSYCKPCNSAKVAAYNKANRAARTEYEKGWVESNRERVNATSRRTHHRHRDEYVAKMRKRQTEARYPGFDKDAALAAQGGVCAICGTDTPKGRGWAVDHDHSCCDSHYRTCGACVRGILCNGCNTGMGFFKDDPELMQTAIEYLRKDWKNRG